MVVSALAFAPGAASGVVFCATAYEQQQANAAAASKVARGRRPGARNGCFVLCIMASHARDASLPRDDLRVVQGAVKDSLSYR